ncbi:hypothetical protein BKA62DRAFT_680017 [Auriculariales sp. MPI-PUGE-AT-0066]|nr:hypothetical protein BKA62DRAFT_680017 [Auriculariales sp. MPI-PUGE-AT-0066]
MSSGGYALWLVPVEHESTELKAIMRFRPPRRRQSDRPTRSYPKFHPHSPDITAHYTSLERGETYLGAMKLMMTASPALAQFRAEIVHRLQRQGLQSKTHRFPHLSLFYVDEADERQRLHRALQSHKFFVKDHMGNLTIKADPKSRGTGLQQFTGAEVWLANCIPRSVESWSVVERITLPTNPPEITRDPTSTQAVSTTPRYQYSQKEQSCGDKETILDPHMISKRTNSEQQERCYCSRPTYVMLRYCAMLCTPFYDTNSMYEKAFACFWLQAGDVLPQTVPMRQADRLFLHYGNNV